MSKPYDEGRRVCLSHGLGISASLCMNAFDMIQKEIDVMVYFKAKGQVQADGYFLLIPYDRKTHEALPHSDGLSKGKYPQFMCSTNALTANPLMKPIREATGPYVQFVIRIYIWINFRFVKNQKELGFPDEFPVSQPMREWAHYIERGVNAQVPVEHLDSHNGNCECCSQAVTGRGGGANTQLKSYCYRCQCTCNGTFLCISVCSKRCEVCLEGVALVTKEIFENAVQEWFKTE
jgi:hypothetical protein